MVSLRCKESVQTVAEWTRRDWYRSAQAIRRDDSIPPPSHATPLSGTIVEEDEQEDSQNEYPTPPEFKPPPPDPSRTAAAAELRIHEVLALLSCFIFPVIGACLLHHIRYQLSRPSEGLVSNYNLTIFLIASEYRPLRHLIKLVQARTLHLQRIASPNAIDADLSTVTPQSLSALTCRLDDLETHIVSSQSPESKPHQLTSNGNPSSNQDIINCARKAMTPDIEALNRAVRRYEKRATLLSMQTEARLADLESRLSDAIALAAAAERNVSNISRKSTAAALLDWGSAAVLFPIHAGYSLVMLPIRLTGGALGLVDEVARGKIRKEIKTATGKTSVPERDRRRERGGRAKRGP